MGSIQAKQSHQIVPCFQVLVGRNREGTEKEVTEAIGEVAKQMSTAFSGALPATSCTSTVGLSPAKKVIIAQNATNNSVI